MEIVSAIQNSGTSEKISSVVFVILAIVVIGYFVARLIGRR